MYDHSRLLKEHGLKSSTQRLFILKSLDERGHASIEEIYEDLKVSNPAISVSAIYRNINEMTKNNMVSEIAISKQKKRYEITKGVHSHLLCQKCGNIIDANINMQDIIKKIEGRYNCHINDQDIIFNVVCAACKKKQEGGVRIKTSRLLKTFCYNITILKENKRSTYYG